MKERLSGAIAGLLDENLKEKVAYFSAFFQFVLLNLPSIVSMKMQLFKFIPNAVFCFLLPINKLFLAGVVALAELISQY